MNITSTGMVSNIASNAMNTSAVNSEQEVCLLYTSPSPRD